MFLPAKTNQFQSVFLTVFFPETMQPNVGTKMRPVGGSWFVAIRSGVKKLPYFSAATDPKKMRRICSSKPTNLHFKLKKCHINHCNLFSSCTDMFSRAPSANGHTYSYSCEHFASVTRILVSQIVSYNPMSYTPFH